MKHSLFLARRTLRLLETFYTIVAFVYFAEFFFAKSETGGAVVSAVSFVICLISYLVREYMDRGIYIVLSHGALAACCYFLPFSLSDSVILMIVCALMCGGALMYISRGSTLRPYEEAPWEKMLLAIGVHLMGIYLKSVFLMNLSYACTVLIFINYLIVLYVDGIEKYMESTKDVTGLPVKNMLRSNSYIVGFVVLIMTLGMLLGQVMDVSESVEAVHSVIVSFVKMIVYFFKYLFIVFLFLTGNLDDDSVGNASLTLQAMETEASNLAKIIDLIIRVTTITIVTIVAVKLLLRFVRWLMLKQVKNGDVVESLVKGRVKDKGDKESGEKKGFALLRTPEETARRAYKLRILRHRDTFLPDRTMTCGDIKKVIDYKELDDIDELNSLYEQVRYGDTPCDKATARKMTALARR